MLAALDFFYGCAVLSLQCSAVLEEPFPRPDMQSAPGLAYTSSGFITIVGDVINSDSGFGVGMGKGAADQLEKGNNRESRTKRVGEAWQTECYSACFSAPLGCCKMMFCAPCLTCHHRKEILGKAWPDGYRCMGGTCNMW